MERPDTAFFYRMREEVCAYFKSPLADFFCIPAHRLMIYAVSFILFGLGVFAALAIYDYSDQLIRIELKFMGMNAWHTAANLVVCMILADMLFAYIARPWGAYERRTVGRTWIIFFGGFLLGFLSERTVAYQLIGLYEPVVIYLWQVDPTQRAGALTMFLFTLPIWLVIMVVVMRIITRKQAQTEEYLRVRIDSLLEARERPANMHPAKRAPSTGEPAAAAGDPLPLPTDPGVGPIHPSEISHVTAEDHYLRIYFEKEEKLQNILVRMTLKEMFARLPEAQFVQIHRSHLVNLESVSRLKRYGQAVKLSMKHGEFELPVSRYRLPQLLPVLEQCLKC